MTNKERKAANYSKTPEGIYHSYLPGDIVIMFKDSIDLTEEVLNTLHSELPVGWEVTDYRLNYMLRFMSHSEMYSMLHPVECEFKNGFSNGMLLPETIINKLGPTAKFITIALTEEESKNMIPYVVVLFESLGWRIENIVQLPE